MIGCCGENSLNTSRLWRRRRHARRRRCIVWEFFIEWVYSNGFLCVRQLGCPQHMFVYCVQQREKSFVAGVLYTSSFPILIFLTFFAFYAMLRSNYLSFFYEKK